MDHGFRALAPAPHRKRRPHITRGWGWLAAVCAAALLFSFGTAVQQVVAQGQERRAVTLQTANTFWRCNTLPGEKARADCRTTAR